jgi:transaldolase
VSRVDAKADARLPAGSELRGRVAIANARQAYWRYRERFTDEPWLTLHDAGAKPQRPLWASTGTKDPAYSDVLYVEELVVPDAINTMPEATLHAFGDHGDATVHFDWSSDAAETLRRAADAGVDLNVITADLEREGVDSFCTSYKELLDCIKTKRVAMVSEAYDDRSADRWCDEGGPVPVEAGTRGGP